MQVLKRFTLVMMIVFGSMCVIAANFEKSVPPDLKSWIPWVNKNLDFLDCPMTEGANPLQISERICAWPDQLVIDVNRTRGEFSQNWKAYKDAWIPLPGDSASWPAMVKINGQSTLVQNRNGAPFIFLSKGVANISGYWRWDSQPEELKIPSISGRLRLTLNGRSVPFPEIGSGALWLGEKQSEKSEADEISVRVYRLITDDHPIRLQTQVQLQISGAAREINLGNALLNDFQLIDIYGDLAAIVNTKNELVIQAKPGSFVVRFDAFSKPKLTQFQFESTQNDWPQQEIWSFQSNPNVRVAMLEQLQLIDPDTAEVPYEWKQFPSFLVESKQMGMINEKFRGLPNDFSSQLKLSRQLWLEFAGSQWRFEDQVQGIVRKNWRMNMTKPYALEFANENNEALLITQLEESQTGVEIRIPNLKLNGGGAIEPAQNLPINGWQSSFQQVDWTLNLPPAHRLVYAGGTESSNTWFEQWNLWNFFWVLLLSVIAYKYLSLPVSVGVLLTLLLMFHEQGAPLVSLSNALFSFAVYRNLNKVNPMLLKIVRSYAIISLGLFVIFLGLFLIQQVRTVIHPQLEHAAALQSYPASRLASYAPAIQEQEMDMLMDEPKEMRQRKMKRNEAEKIVITGSRIQKKDLISRYQSDTLVQTGSGKPAWRWNTYRLSWNSPVHADQTVNLWIANPWLMSLWRLFMVLGLMLVAGFIGTRLFDKKISWKHFKQAPLALVLIVAGGFYSSDSRADIPDKELLVELQQWLHQSPECAPQCVAITKMNIQSDKSNKLVLQLEVDVFSDYAMILPRSKDWKIQQIKIDSQPSPWVATFKQKDWIALSKGQRKVTLEGVVAGTNSVIIQFEEPPFNINNQSTLWEMEGVRHGSLLSSELGLIRKQQHSNTPVEQAVSEIKPMAYVRRSFTFDNEWSMTTTVERIAPLRGAINLRIPKLSFEKITTPGIQYDESGVLVQIAAGDHQSVWQSMLPIGDGLDMTAFNSNDFVEEWSFLVSHQWHAEINGVPQVWPRQHDDNDIWQFRYLPRADEILSLQISRPSAVKGNTQSFDRLSLSMTSGERQRQVDLQAEYRSTRGGQGEIHIPQGENLNASIDGQKTYLQIQNGVIDYTIAPGSHSLNFDWKEPLELGFKTEFPKVNLNAPVSNLSVTWAIPGRWVVWTKGPVIGPAIIYWGELLAFIILATVVWRVKLLPISPFAWFVLGLGLSTQSWWLLVAVTLWLLVMQWHKRQGDRWSETVYNLIQIGLCIFSLMVFLSLIAAVPLSLLSQPDMGIVGNYSNQSQLNWYQDATSGITPDIVVFSLPMWLYKMAMLLWALWLAFALVRWSRWGWSCLTEFGFWKQEPLIQKPKVQHSSTDTTSKP